MTEKHQVTPKAWIADAIASARAEEFIKRYGKHVATYGGSIHGSDVKGVVDVEFKDLHSACAFVTWSQLNKCASLRETATPFLGTVVVQFNMKLLTA